MGLCGKDGSPAQGLCRQVWGSGPTTAAPKPSETEDSKPWGEGPGVSGADWGSCALAASTWPETSDLKRHQGCSCGTWRCSRFRGRGRSGRASGKVQRAPRNRGRLLRERPLVRNLTRRKSRLLTYDPCRPVSPRGGTCHRVCFPPPFWKHVAQPLNGGGPGAGPSGRGGRGGCRDPGLGPQCGRRAPSSASLHSAWGRAASWWTTVFPHGREGSFQEEAGAAFLWEPLFLFARPHLSGGGQTGRRGSTRGQR